MAQSTMFAFFVTLSVLVALFALVRSVEEVGHPELTNGWDSKAMEKAILGTNAMELPNDTFVYFYFTNVGSWVSPQFQTTVPLFTDLSLYWWDLYCAGDQLQLYATVDFGGPVVNFSFPARAPIGEASCVNYTLDPDTATANTAFSVGSFFTGTPSVINYTFVPVLSPFSAGRAVVKAVYTTP